MLNGALPFDDAMEDLLIEIVEFVLHVDSLVVDLVLDLRQPVMTKIMTSVTGLGNASAGLVIVGLFYLAGWEKEFRETLIGLTVAVVIVAFLMITVKRPFPPHPICVKSGSEMVAHSFPSGHAAAVTVYSMVAHRSAVLPFAPVLVIAILVAVSRMYLGTHYLSDSVVGVAIGVVSFLAAKRMLGNLDGSITGRN
jgi:membrane-associated phospholipid phosphatase